MNNLLKQILIAFFCGTIFCVFHLWQYAYLKQIGLEVKGIAFVIYFFSGFIISLISTQIYYLSTKKSEEGKSIGGEKDATDADRTEA